MNLQGWGCTVTMLDTHWSDIRTGIYSSTFLDIGSWISACNEATPTMSNRIGAIISPAALLIFSWRSSSEIAKSYQKFINKKGHGMLVKLKMHVTLKKNTATYVQLCPQNSDLKRSRRRCQRLGPAGKQIDPQFLRQLVDIVNLHP